MRCPRCVQLGLPSRVFPAPATTSARPLIFYDEQGVFHLHEVDAVVVGFACSQGHHWQEPRPTHCPAGCEE